MGKGNKDTSIYKFGTSQLKTFDYFYAKKPIIQALNSIENPVVYANAGYVIEPENEKELREVIDRFRTMEKSERKEYGMRGYRYLLKHCTYEQISEKLEKELHKLDSGG